MEYISGTGVVLAILAVIVALFVYDYASKQGWTGSRSL